MADDMLVPKLVEVWGGEDPQVEVSIINWDEVVCVRATQRGDGLYVFGRNLLKETEGLTWALGWNTREAAALRTHHALGPR